MSKLRGYHCNTCGAWLLVGEIHSCDPARLAAIDKIKDFFSDRSNLIPEELHQDELHEILGLPESTDKVTEQAEIERLNNLKRN